MNALRDGLPHSYADELPPPRQTVEREPPGVFWRAFLTFAMLIVALYLLTIAAGIAALERVAP